MTLVRDTRFAQAITQIENKIQGTDFMANEYSADGEYVSLGVQVEQNLLQNIDSHVATQTDEQVSFSLASHQQSMNVSASASEWMSTLAMIPALLSQALVQTQPPARQESHLQQHHSSIGPLKISVCT